MSTNTCLPCAGPAAAGAAGATPAAGRDIIPLFHMCFDIILKSTKPPKEELFMSFIPYGAPVLRRRGVERCAGGGPFLLVGTWGQGTYSKDLTQTGCEVLSHMLKPKPLRIVPSNIFETITTFHHINSVCGLTSSCG